MKGWEGRSDSCSGALTLVDVSAVCYGSLTNNRVNDRDLQLAPPHFASLDADV